MKRVASVTHLKASLSALLAQVKSGEEILITERGRPIARVVPYRGDPGSDETQARLIREGVLRPGEGSSLREFLAGRPRARSRASVLEALLEEREQSR